LNGRPFAPVAAFAIVASGELSIALVDTSFDCERVRAHRDAAVPYLALFLFVADFNGAKPRAPSVGGRFRVYPFSEYRMAGVTSKEAARQGLAIPARGQIASGLVHAGDGNRPFPVSGWVDVDAIDPTPSSRLTGSYALVLESGEAVSGRFDAEVCEAPAR
jgi:hypothetical protein